MFPAPDDLKGRPLRERSRKQSFSNDGFPADNVNCDLIAPWYEPVEHLSFGHALERRRTAFLNRIGPVRNAISCGEGDGRFVAELLRANPNVQVTAVDASARMTQLAERRVIAMGADFASRGRFYRADVNSFTPPAGPYDLIATHFFFDCFATNELERIIPRIAAWAAPRAQWIVSEFQQPPDPLAHLWTGAVIRSLYGAFRVTTGLRTTHLPSYRPALVAAGFKLQQQETACAGLLISEMWRR